MKLLPVTPEAIAEAAAALRRGELVAFPTETVYGLGADARNPDAVQSIFAAKGRPANHPLIVHLPDAVRLGDWASEVPELAYQLAEAFWPGPLTLILKRSSLASDLVTGDQDTVGLRVPGHPAALALLRAFGDGVAAPSANRFGRISPTRAEHVLAELGERVGLILDGGASQIGLESTILDLSGGKARVLRPGGIRLEALAAVLGYRPEVVKKAEARASGTLKSHYAPCTPARLVSAAELDELGGSSRVGVLSRREEPAAFAGVWKTLPSDAEGYAYTLYAALRDLDALGLGQLYLEAVPTTDAWLAVRDRLRRATTPALEEAQVP